MYKKINYHGTTLKNGISYQATTIEGKIRKIMENKEGITDGAPIIYTERKDGVQPAYDIRTDRFEIAIDAMDKIAKQHKAKREERIGQRAMENMKKEQANETKTEGGTQSTEGK